MPAVRVGFWGTVGINPLLIKALEKSRYANELSLVCLDRAPLCGSAGRMRRLAEKVIKRVKAVSSLRGVDVLVCTWSDKRTKYLRIITRFFHVKLVCFWVGSDVLNLLEGGFPASCVEDADLHLAAGDNLVAELASCGIESERMLVPVLLPTDIAKMPDRHAVLLSIPDSRAKFYGYDTLTQVIKRYPDVPFYIVRSDSPEMYDEPNVVFKGVVSQKEMDRIYDEISICIRFPKHDGTSFVLIEGLMKGKALISNQAFPRARKVASFEEICEAINVILEDPPTPDTEGHEFAVDYFGQKRWGDEIGAKIMGLVGMGPREYDEEAARSERLDYVQR